GRRHGSAVLGRFPSVAQQAGRVFRLIERYQAWVIVGVRFAYGLRIAGPIIIGTARVSPKKFAIFNALGAVVWAILVAGFGFLFGEAANRIFGDLHDIEIWLLLALVVVVVGITLVQRYRARRNESSCRDN